MDDQEMQFAPPEWRPPTQQHAAQEQEADNNPQLVYTPPSAQPSWQAPPTQSQEAYNGPDYEAGYQGQHQQQQPRSEQVFSQQHRRRSPLPWIIGLVIIIVVFGGTGKDGFFLEIGLFRSLLLAVFLLGIIWWIISMGLGKGRPSFVNQRIMETRSFPVGMHPTVVIKDGFGTIRVH